MISCFSKAEFTKMNGPNASESAENPVSHGETGGFCRDCGADIPPAPAGPIRKPKVLRCPACRSPRIARHPALASIGITASIGLSHNKFLAKIASDLDKPRGLSVIGRAETLRFLAEKPVSMIWGVGKVMREKLEHDGIASIGQLQTMTEIDLARRYGKMGSHLFHLDRGLEDLTVDPEVEAKSITAQTN